MPAHVPFSKTSSAGAGALGGGAIGLVVGGPPGAVVGAVLGGIGGAIFGKGKEQGRAEGEPPKQDIPK
jgi:hypothetical protein